MKKHTAIVYVYGTLRPGGPDTVQIPGNLYDLGWYPGAEIKGGDYPNSFLAERVEIPLANLELLDNYEGYRPERPEGSLFLRVPYLDGWIYTYNKGFEGRKRIESGDFLAYMGQSSGSAALKLPKKEIVTAEMVSPCQVEAEYNHDEEVKA